MPTFAQYNPSTGKASYNAVTGKQQVLRTPGYTYCGAAAGYVVTFSGVTLGDGCCIWTEPSPDHYYFHRDVPDINENTYLLHSAISCTYLSNLYPVLFTREDHGIYGCGGSFSVRTYTAIRLQINVNNPPPERASLELKFVGDTGTDVGFSALYDTTGLGGEIVDAPNNNAECISPTWGGTATVKGIYEWGLGTVYVEGDYVEYSGDFYICINDNMSDTLNAPPNASFWELRT